uniref:Uncharacterized protein n=2 Tax=Vibrio TaxID=662 RepID=A0A0H3ZR73_9VIBR|nr:hypothetical protein [Vibrio tasmaniensis]AKN40834.1 hypothetical protein [Vibrio sp. 1F_189]
MFITSWLRHQAGRAAHLNTNNVFTCGQLGCYFHVRWVKSLG